MAGRAHERRRPDALPVGRRMSCVLPGGNMSAAVKDIWENSRTFAGITNNHSIMKYLLVSDIHGCLPALEKVLRFYDREHCGMLCILGDILNYGPRNSIPEGIDAKGIVEALNRRAGSIVAVRGNCDAEVDQMLLDFPMMADYLLLVDEGRRLFLTHGHIYNKVSMPKGSIDAIVYGHTHLWELTRQDRTLVCNLGSITFPKGGNVPTFMVYEHGVFTAYTLDGEVLAQERL